MASKQFIPKTKKEWVGPDDQKVIPPRLELPNVVFASGSAGVAKAVKQLTLVREARVEAPCGAGKSTALPYAMVTGGFELLVHVVPSRAQAAGLSRYVKAKYTDVPVTFLGDLVTDFPKTGWVITSSAVFCVQAAMWRVVGCDLPVTLYMDEFHDPDGATTVLREVRSGVPGIVHYFEASATPGTGDSSSSFRSSNMPGESAEFKTYIPPPDKWDFVADTEGLKPWGFKKLNGHVLVYEDLDEQADALMRKCAEHNVPAFRWTGRMNPNVFLENLKTLESNPTSAFYIVADSTFRSSFSFPTVTRYIDRCNVKVVRITGNNMANVEVRRAYSSEVHQARNRAGRIPGLQKVMYFRPDYVPDNVAVRTTGIEVSVACILFRMLGYAPVDAMRGNAFASGAVPSNLYVALAGEEPLPCYSRDSEWQHVEPVKADARRSLLMAETESVVSVDREDCVSGDESDASESRVMAQAAERAKSYVRVRPVDPGLVQTSDILREVRDKMRKARNYHGDVAHDYYVVDWGVVGGKEPVVRVEHSYAIVLRDSLGNIDEKAFLGSVTAEQKCQVYAAIVADHNDAIAKYRAIASVLGALRDRPDSLMFLDPDEYGVWSSGLESDMNILSSRLDACAAFMHWFPARLLERKTVAYHQALFRDWVEVVMHGLRACVLDGSGFLSMGEEPGGAEIEFSNTHVMEHAVKKYSGRVRGRVVGKGFRAKLANAVLGKGERSFDIATR